MVFNTAIISVGTGLLKADNPPMSYLLIAAIFLVGFFSSLIGWWAIRKGHEYYRRRVVRRPSSKICSVSQLPSPITHTGTLAVGTTTGQADHLKILHDPEQWVNRTVRRGSITFLLSAILILLAVINLGGATTSVWLSFHPANHYKPIPPLVFPATI